MRAAADGFLGCGPAFPGFADDRQPETLGHPAVKHAERHDQVLHSLEGADHAEIKQAKRRVGGLRPWRGGLGEVIVGTMRDDPDRNAGQRVAGGDRLLVERGVNDVARYARQQPGHEQADVLAGPRQFRLSHVLAFVPLQDDARTAPRGIPGQPQVGVQHGTGPPLQDDHLGTLLIDEPQRPAHGPAPIPVHAVVHRDIGRVDGVGNVRADPLLAWVEALRHQAAHQEGAHLTLICQGGSQPVGVMADPGRETPARTDDQHPRRGIPGSPPHCFLAITSGAACFSVNG